MQTEPKNPIRIHAYLDFREFLRDKYKARKREHPSFSYRYIGGKVGLDSGTLTRILKGERNLDPEMAARLARVFGLDESEQDFFEALVLYGQARSHAEKNHFLEKIFRMRGVKADALEERQYEYFREWYNVALRELLNFHAFDGDYKSLARMLRPAIRPVEAKRALQLLLDLGLVENGADGKPRLTQKLVTSGDGIRAVLVKNLHLSMAELALRALADVDPKERDFSGLTVSVSERGFDKLRVKLKQFRQEILEIANQDADVDRVYRVNLQLFPVSRVQGRE